MTQRQQGFTLIELVITAAIGATILLALNSMLQMGFQVLEGNTTDADRQREAAAALDRMVTAIRGSRRLMLPLPDNPNTTDLTENIREQTVPASPPEAGSTLATAVLAVTLSPLQDADGDGWADGNIDQDFLDYDNDGNRDDGEPELIDEDSSADLTFDGAAGIIGIDDNGDGSTDVLLDPEDDDEDGAKDEDELNGIDDDGDGNIDEDPPADLHKSSKSGLKEVDDNFNGVDDEGEKDDDDEDGLLDEDWLDPVVFYLSGTDLIFRQPAMRDVAAPLGTLNGLDFIESILASNIIAFRVERISAARATLVDLSITVQLEGTTRTYVARARLGASL